MGGLEQSSYAVAKLFSSNSDEMVAEYGEIKTAAL
jgi:hypothetical protein